MREPNVDQYVPLEVYASRKRIRKDEEAVEKEKWKKFKIAVSGKFPSSVVHLSLLKQQKDGFNVIVGGSTRVEFNQIRLVAEQKGSVPVSSTRNYTRLKNYLRCVDIRKDGKLGVVADESGLVQIFDIQTRSQLRRLRGHTGPVHAVSFSRHNGSYVLSGGDDTTLRLWDISDGSCKVEIANAHGDSIHAIVSSPTNVGTPGVLQFATGAYDGYIRIWDINIENGTSACVSKFLHGLPVESIDFFPIGNLLVSAGGPEVKIWDLTGGGRMVHSLTAHMKTVMAVSVSPDGSYILTGSLDQSVKFFCSSRYVVLHSISLEDAVTSVLCQKASNDIETIAIGMSDGHWQIRKKLYQKSDEVSNNKRLKTLELRANTASYYARGPETEPKDTDVVLDVKLWKNSTALDRLIQSFRYQSSFERAIRMGSSIAVAYLELLIENGVLHIAVRGRDEKTIYSVLRFVCKEFGKNPQTTPLYLELIYTLLAQNPWLYSTPSRKMLMMLESLSTQLDDEIAQHQITREISGLIELIGTATEKAA